MANDQVDTMIMIPLEKMDGMSKEAIIDTAEREAAEGFSLLEKKIENKKPKTVARKRKREYWQYDYSKKKQPRVKDINGKVRELNSLAGYIFLDAMLERKTLEDNDWQFEQLPDMTEALATAHEVKAGQTASEIDKFVQYLEERAIFGKDEMVKQTTLKADYEEYCKNLGRPSFEKAIVNEGINIRVCSVFGLTANEYKDTYNKDNRGMNKSVKGDSGWRYIGIGLKQ